MTTTFVGKICCIASEPCDAHAREHSKTQYAEATRLERELSEAKARIAELEKGRGADVTIHLTQAIARAEKAETGLRALATVLVDTSGKSTPESIVALVARAESAERIIKQAGDALHISVDTAAELVAHVEMAVQRAESAERALAKERAEANGFLDRLQKAHEELAEAREEIERLKKDTASLAGAFHGKVDEVERLRERTDEWKREVERRDEMMAKPEERALWADEYTKARAELAEARAQCAAYREALEFCEREAKSVQLRLESVYEDGGCTGRASDDADGIECQARGALSSPNPGEPLLAALREAREALRHVIGYTEPEMGHAVAWCYGKPDGCLPVCTETRAALAKIREVLP